MFVAFAVLHKSVAVEFDLSVAVLDTLAKAFQSLSQTILVAHVEAQRRKPKVNAPPGRPAGAFISAPGAVSDTLSVATVMRRHWMYQAIAALSIINHKNWY